ncbi:inactive rhomboid protein 1-like [Rhagoletis pomonella]|uniref:inactive rhomboid protein 1-like n=1 Tax=Rhagoletis pomonella TaxID=28610 RepID=UPI00177A8118|nr:inactive rhomboid protein 1-like [Rhagoletis pomonella]
MISPNPSNCSESDHHLHHHVHHTATAASQTGGHSGSSRGRIVSSSNVCGARCKSMLGYQPQLQMVNDNDVVAGNSCSDTGSTGGRYSPHPNEMFLHHHGKLSIQPITGYDDATNCCLPPPSPAPNNDRYIMGVASPKSAQICGANGNVSCLEMHATYANYDSAEGNSSANGNAQSQQANIQQHHQHQQQPQHIHYAAQSLSSSTSTSPLAANSGCVTNFTQKYVSSMQQCSISPNTRFRLSDRYREVPTPKSLVLNNPSSVGSQNAYASATGAVTSQPSSAARYVTSAHFLTQSTPLVASDTYTYLSSTVHTPVKRYVPTPPPPNELYTDISMQPPPPQTPQTLSKCGTNSNVVGVNGTGGHTTQHVNTLPYRFRMKCCTNDPHNPAVTQTTNLNTSPLTHNLEHRPLSVTDYYATSPRTRPTYGNSSHSGRSGHNSSACYSGNTNVMVNSKCTSAIGKDSSILILHDQQMQTTGHSASTKVNGTGSCLSSSTLAGSVAGSVSGRSSTASPTTVPGNNCNGMYVVGVSRLNTTSSARANNTNVISDYIQRTPSIEYINATATAVGPIGGRISTPVTQIEGNSGNGANSSSMNSNAGAATTCLHCNTVRRTTGVHQTTQTTGPISPIPLQQMMDVISTGAVGGMNNCNGGFLQNVLDHASLTLTPSTSESHISPLSPSVAGAHSSHIPFPSKMDDGSIGGGVEHLQQQQIEQIYIAQKSQKQQPKNVITQGTVTEHVGVVSGNLGSIGGPQQQHKAVGGSRSFNHQQLMQSMQQQVMHQPQQSSPLQQPLMQQQQKMQRFSRKKRFSQYIRKEIARFFGVDASSEAEEFAIWQGRQRRLALRRFGALKTDSELHAEMSNNNSGEANNRVNCYGGSGGTSQQYHQHHHHHSERPDILPAHDTEDNELAIEYSTRRRHFLYADFQIGDHIERKATVATMIMSSLTFIVHTLNRRQTRNCRQWSRSFAPAHINNINGIDNSGDAFECLSALQDDEVFFDSAGTEQAVGGGNLNGNNNSNSAAGISLPQSLVTGGFMRTGGSTMIANSGAKVIEHHRQIYMGERVHGWRTSSVIGGSSHATTNNEQVTASAQASNSGGGVSISVGLGGQQLSNVCSMAGSSQQTKKSAIAGQITASSLPNVHSTNGTRGYRISAQLLDGVLENSRRPIQRKVKLFSVTDLDDRADHRPFFTYWINTVQILVLLLSLICYGIGPIGIGVEQKTGQVLVTSLSLQTVQHTEQRNVWIGPRNNDLVHMGAKFATCMRSDVRIIDVLLKTRRQERETACCIRNDDSGCVQSSQADCSVRGLFPTKSISTWKKWSPGESGPGGRISGSVCGLDPKYCDAPASIAPYEWPDDITKWPICRKTNSFSQRFRYKDHTAEHMVCEVIGHPCCTGVYGECRITTREYCDFVNGYFHEEASLCSQVC